MTNEINVAEATELARQRLLRFEREWNCSLRLGPPSRHEVGWSFFYTGEDGETSIGGLLILVTRDRRVHEIGFPHDVELFVRTVLENGRNDNGELPTYDISDAK